MIYGRDGVFDAENAIDLLQALEKFKSVRDDGDGSSFKVNGVRGTKVVGSAGDFRGSQVVDTSDRDSDSRFRLSNGRNNAALASGPYSSNRLSSSGSSTLVRQQPAQTQRDQQTVREALRFFFSPEGEVFREFMLEEIVNVVDASGRGAVQELSRSLGLNNFPVPGFVRALYPEINEKDRNIIKQIRILFNFLMGDYNDTSIASSARLRQLIPIAREYSPQLRDFGLLLAARLTEKNLSRGMNWATEQLARNEVRSYSSSRM
jgi:aarF domain-containing kinase